MYILHYPFAMPLISGLSKIIQTFSVGLKHVYSSTSHKADACNIDGSG